MGENLEPVNIISYSGGLGSFLAAWLTVKTFGKENCRLVFTDTKTEDEDLYRFLRETSLAMEIEPTILADGRDIWGVFTDVKFMGNSRIDPCSRILKRDLFRKYVESKYFPQDCVIVFGVGMEEEHRMKAIKERWAPYKTSAPLCEVKRPIDKEQVENLLSDLGIDPPRLYEMGFPHNNCGGFCVKTGQKQMRLLLEKFPERYRWHEEQQEKLFAIIGKRHGFIRKVVDGEMQYMGLMEFREFLEHGGEAEMLPAEGCGCFV